MPYPSPFPRCTWQHYGASIKPRVDGDAKGPIVNVNMHRRSQDPRIIATMDLTIRSCRTAPSLPRTNLHANLPPLSAMSSARRASSQACASLTDGLVCLNFLVYSMLCRSPVLLNLCKPHTTRTSNGHACWHARHLPNLESRCCLRVVRSVIHDLRRCYRV